MKESEIDTKEKFLAFRCLRCRHQVAEGVTIDDDGTLNCPGCGGDLRQMPHDELFGESWGNMIDNPYYDGPEEPEEPDRKSVWEKVKSIVTGG